MPSLSPPSSPQRIRRRQAFWYRTLYARILLFAFSSGIGGCFVGSVIGFDNWWETGRVRPWWYWVGFTLCANGIFMTILGLFVGAFLLALLSLATHRWSVRRRHRLALSMKFGLFLPMAIGVAVTSLVMIAVRSLLQGISVSTRFNLGDFIGDAQLVALVLLPIPLIGRLLFLSKSSRPQKPILTERILPLE